MYQAENHDMFVEKKIGKIPTCATSHSSDRCLRRRWEIVIKMIKLIIQTCFFLIVMEYAFVSRVRRYRRRDFSTFSIQQTVRGLVNGAVTLYSAINLVSLSSNFSLWAFHIEKRIIKPPDNHFTRVQQVFRRHLPRNVWFDSRKAPFNTAQSYFLQWNTERYWIWQVTYGSKDVLRKKPVMITEQHITSKAKRPIVEYFYRRTVSMNVHFVLFTRLLLCKSRFMYEPIYFTWCFQCEWGCKRLQ